MRYELLEHSDAGIITDPTPVLRDIKDTFTVYIDTPDSAAYIALFKGEDNVEYKAPVREGAATVPKELLSKDQRVTLTVCRVEGDAIARAWACHSLRVGAFLQLRQPQRHITTGADDAELYARLAEIERQHADTLAAFEALRADYARRIGDLAAVVSQCKLEVYEATKALASLKSANEKVTTAHNEAIQVLNDLSRRLGELEKGYDPTVN